MNVRNSEKIQDKWLLFQRFVTSIVAVSGGSTVSVSLALAYSCGGVKIRVGAYFIFDKTEGKNLRFQKEKCGYMWTGAHALYYRHHEVSTCPNSYRNYKKMCLCTQGPS